MGTKCNAPTGGTHPPINEIASDLVEGYILAGKTEIDRYATLGSFRISQFKRVPHPSAMRDFISTGALFTPDFLMHSVERQFPHTTCTAFHTPRSMYERGGETKQSERIIWT